MADTDYHVTLGLNAFDGTDLSYVNNCSWQNPTVTNMVLQNIRSYGNGSKKINCKWTVEGQGAWENDWQKTI